MPDRSLGIDIGGTFTDFVLIDTESRTLRVWKVLTTPQDPTLAIMRGVAAQPIVDAGGLDSLARVIHGTTLVANTIIERTGAKVGLIMTAGHRDVLEIGNELRYDLHDLFMVRRKPIVPPSLPKEVREPIWTSGGVRLGINGTGHEDSVGDSVAPMCELRHALKRRLHDV